VDLAIYGSPTAGIAGVSGSTYSIDSCSDFFLSDNGYPEELRGSAEKSISAWAYLGAKGGDGDGVAPIASFGGGSCVVGSSFAVNYSTEAASGDAPNLATCGADLRPATSAWDLDTWYHIVGTYNGSQLELYINGVSVGTVAQTLDTNTEFDHVGIGIDTVWSGTFHWLCDGRVDEVKLYDYALSPSDVSALHSL
jgi:hypothetical protein